MDSRTTNRITLHVAVLGVLLAAGTFLIGGVEPGLGALAGALVALLNWLALRWIMLRVQSGTTRKKAGLMILLVLKMAALMALSWALMARWGVHPIGFAAGMGAIVLGLPLGSARSMLEQPAGEEA